jgi:hypothetical protein
MSHDETWRRGSTPGAASIDVREDAEDVFLETAAAFAQPDDRNVSRAPRRTVGDGASVTSARTGISDITAARSSMRSLHTEAAEQPLPASASEPDTSAAKPADSSISSVTHSVLTRPDGALLNALSLAARRRQRELAGAQPSAGPARTVILHADEPTLARAGGGRALEWQAAVLASGDRAVASSATNVPQAGELMPPKPPAADSTTYWARPEVEGSARRAKAVVAPEAEDADAPRLHSSGVFGSAGTRVASASPTALGVGLRLGVSTPESSANPLATPSERPPGKAPSSTGLAAAAAYTDSLTISAATASTSIRASFESALQTLSSVAARAALYQRQLAWDGASALVQHTFGAAALSGGVSVAGSAGADANATAVAAATDASARITAAASALNASADQAGVTAAVLRHIEEGRSCIAPQGDHGPGASLDGGVYASQTGDTGVNSTAAGGSSAALESYLQGARPSYRRPSSGAPDGRQNSSSVPTLASAAGQTASARGRTESRLGGRYQNGYRVVDDTASAEGATIAEGATSAVWNSREQSVASVASRAAGTEGDRSGASHSASARARSRSRASTPASAAGSVRPRGKQNASVASDLSDAWIQGLVGEQAESSTTGAHGGSAASRQRGSAQFAATAAAWGAGKPASTAGGASATAWSAVRGQPTQDADPGATDSSQSQTSIVDADLVAAGTSASAGHHYARALQEVQLARQRIQRAVSAGRAGHTAHGDSGQSEEEQTCAETAAAPSSILVASLSAHRLHGSRQQQDTAAASALGLSASIRPLSDASPAVQTAGALASSTAYQPRQLVASPHFLECAETSTTAARGTAAPEDASTSQRFAQSASPLHARAAAAESTALSDALKGPSPGRGEPTVSALQPQASAASSFDSTSLAAALPGVSNPAGALTVSPRQALAELQALRLRVEAALRASAAATSPPALSLATAGEWRRREPSAASVPGGVAFTSALHRGESSRPHAAARAASPPAAHRLLSTPLLETSFTSLHALGSHPMSKLATASDSPPQAYPSTHHENNTADVSLGSESTEGRRPTDATKSGEQLRAHPRDSHSDAASARSLFYRLQFTEQQLARVMAEVATLRAGRAVTEEGPTHPA